MVEDRGELRVLRVGAVDRFDSGERSRAVAENVPLIENAVEKPEMVDETVVDVERAVHGEGEEAAVRVGSLQRVCG